MGRTTRRFQAHQDFWRVLDGWARREGFRLKHQDDVRRVYQKGLGLGVAPILVQAIHTEPWAHLQAWVRVNLLVRPGALIFAPSEMALEPGGFRLARSRRVARALVNRLLDDLGQPLVPSDE